MCGISNIIKVLGFPCDSMQVGGEFFETVLFAMNEYGRVSVCGSISTYNVEDPPKGTWQSDTSSHVLFHGWGGVSVHFDFELQLYRSLELHHSGCMLLDLKVIVALCKKFD